MSFTEDGRLVDDVTGEIGYLMAEAYRVATYGGRVVAVYLAQDVFSALLLDMQNYGFEPEPGTLSVSLGSPTGPISVIPRDQDHTHAWVFEARS